MCIMIPVSIDGEVGHGENNVPHTLFNTAEPRILTCLYDTKAQPMRKISVQPRQVCLCKGLWELAW